MAAVAGGPALAGPDGAQGVRSTGQEEAPSTFWSRRDFLTLAAWGGVLASLGAALVEFVRYMLPRPLIEPAPGVDAGWPDTYPASGTGGARHRRTALGGPA